MATRRTTIQIEVLGLDALREANTALARHNTAITKLTAAYQGLNAVTGQVATGFTSINQTFNTTNTTINNTSNTVNNLRSNLNSANTSGQNMLGTFLQYRAVHLIFQQIVSGVEAAAKAMLEMEKQAARVQRVSAPGSTPLIRSVFAEEASRTGADIKDIGEAYYQLQTRIGNTATSAEALKVAMNLVVGTEADARDVSREMLQLVVQFPQAFAHAGSEAEKYRRAGELMAATFKDSAAETTELANALKYLGPIAEAAKVPLAQVTAVVTELTAEGQRGRMGGTEAGQLIANLIKGYNAELGGIEKKGLVYHFKLETTADGGIDLIKTLRSIVETANGLPTDKAREFLLAIGGSQNAFRFLGTQGVDSLRRIEEFLKHDQDAINGLTHDSDKLRETMTTTAREFQRSWEGAITAVGNTLDGSGLKAFFKGIADDLQRINEQSHQMVGSNLRMSGILGGDGAFAGDTNALKRQVMAQKLLLQETLDAATEKNLSGKQTVSESAWGLFQYGGSNQAMDLYNEAYKGRGAADRGYLQRFMSFTHNPNDPSANSITMDLPAMQAELNRLSALLPRLDTNAPLTRADVPAASSLGLKGLTPAQAENAAIITAAAKRYGVDPLAMIAVAHYESGLSATARNPSSSATGLFQILSGTAPGINRADPFQNAQFAAKSFAAAGGRGLTGDDAIKMFVEQFERPGAAATPAEEAAAKKFYANQGLGGGAHGAAITKSPETLQKEADERAKKEAAILDQKAQTAQIEFDHLKKSLGIDDARTIAAGKFADALAARAGDANERLKLRYGLTGNIAGLTDEQRKAREDAAKQAEKDRLDALKTHAEATSFYAESAQGKYGLFSRITTQRADEAQKAALAAAQADGDTIQSWKLIAGVEGPLKDLIDKRKEAVDEGVKSVEQANQDIANYARSFADDIVGASAARAHARDLTARPYGTGSVDERREAILSGNVADFQRTLDLLKKDTPDATDQIVEMKNRLQDANAALLDFHDQLAQQAYERRVRAEEDAFQLRNEDITHLHRLKLTTDENAASRDKIKEYQELVQSAQQHLQIVKDRPLSDKTPDDIRAAAKELTKAQQDLNDYQIESRIQKYQQVYGQVKSDINGAFMNALHGKGSAGDLLKSIGDNIINAAMEAQVKQFTDPLIHTVTKEILTIQGNTDAIGKLTQTLKNPPTVANGGSSGAGGGDNPGSLLSQLSSIVGSGTASAAGGGGGLASLGGSGLAGAANAVGAGSTAAAGGLGALGGLGGALGALSSIFSVGSTAASQGTNLGNVLGAGLAGFQLGGPIGAAVGVGIDLIGGLFHHKSKPTQTPQDLNPAAYNAPSAFEMGAYNYSAYGTMPTMQNVGFTVPKQNVPVVNVYVDGAKVAARQEMDRQTTLSHVSLTNTGAAFGHSPL